MERKQGAARVRSGKCDALTDVARASDGLSEAGLETHETFALNNEVMSLNVQRGALRMQEG